MALAALLTVLGFWLVALVISSPALIQRLPAFYRGVAILTLNTLVLLACIEVAATGVLKIWTGIADEQQLRHRLPFGGQHWQHKWWVVTPLILVLLLCGGLLIAERPDLVGQSIVVTPFMYTLF